MAASIRLDLAGGDQRLRLVRLFFRSPPFSFYALRYLCLLPFPALLFLLTLLL